MINNKKLKLFFAVIGVLLVGGASFFLYNKLIKSDPISLLPEETSFYLRVKINPENQQVKNLKELLNKFPYYGEIEKMIQENVETLKEKSFKSKDVDFSISDELILAFPTDLQMEQQTKDTSMVLILPFVDLNKLKKLGEDFKEDKEIEIEEENYRGITISKIVLSKEENSYGPESQFKPCFSVIKGHLVFGSGTKDIKKIIDVSKDQEITNLFKGNKAKSIISKPTYQKIKKNLSKDYLALLYADVSLDKIIQTSEKMDSIQKVGFLSSITSKITDSLGFLEDEIVNDEGKSITMAGTIFAREDKIEVESYMTGMKDSLIPTQFSINQSLSNFIPQKINEQEIFYYSEGRGLDEEYQAFQEGLFEELEPGVDKDIDKEFEEILGINPESIFTLLEGNYAFFVTSESSGDEMPIMAFMAEVEDEKQLEENLSKLILPKELTDPPQLGIAGIELARNKASDARIMADMSQMRTVAEMISDFGEGYQDLSCQHDDNMRIICQDIKEQIGSYPVIRKSQLDYCAYVKLNEPRAYYCVDGSGRALKTYMNPESYCNSNNDFNCPSEGTAPDLSSESEKVSFSSQIIRGVKIHSVPLMGKFDIAFAVKNNKVVFSLDKKIIPEIMEGWDGEVSNNLQQNEEFAKQFENIPDEITSIYYSSPYGYAGFLKAILRSAVELSQEIDPQLSQEIDPQYSMLGQYFINPLFELIDEGISPYLKVLKAGSSYSYLLESEIIANKGILMIEELPLEEKEKVEEFWRNFPDWIEGILSPEPPSIPRLPH